jgi:hypothetical protein
VTLLVLLFLSLFAPPVSWKEIFFVSTLKQLSSALPLFFDSSLKGTDISGLQLSFAFHEPPWFLGSVIPLHRALLSYLPAECELQFGGCAVFSVRLIALGLALFTFFTVRLALQHRSSLDNSSAPQDSLNWSAFFIFCAAALLFLVRIGAIEQLLVASAFPLFLLSREAHRRHNQGSFKTLLLFLAISLLFALSGSRLWISTIALSALVFSWLQSATQASAIRKSVAVSLIIVALSYTGLFLLSGSYISLCVGSMKFTCSTLTLDGTAVLSFGRVSRCG